MTAQPWQPTHPSTGSTAAARVTMREPGRFFTPDRALHSNSIQESVMPRKYTPAESIAAFWSKVNRDGPTQPHMETPCWVWNGSRATSGHGRAWSRGRLDGAHRVAFVLAFGTVSAGLQVLHRCDHPPCVRPDHLWLGDNAANVADREAKGRGQCGVKHWLAKLSDDGVRRIRERYATGAVTQKQIAAGLGVSRECIQAVLAGDAWKHVK